MITIRLMGGLGNQLFQVAAAAYLTKVRSIPARCDTSWFSARLPSGDTPRSLEVSTLLRGKERCHYSAIVSRVVYSTRNPRLLRETGPQDDIIGNVPWMRAWLLGYYQRATYPLAVQDELAERLLPILDAGEPADRSDAIGVHIRLGDYHTNATTRAHHGLSKPEYFALAIERVQREFGGSRIIVFSDSPDVLASDYARHLPTSVELSTADSAWDSLRELSQCGAIIMSNSSLSWWAAFAATVLRHREVVVIKPSPWFSVASSIDHALAITGWIEMRRLFDTMAIQ